MTRRLLLTSGRILVAALFLLPVIWMTAAAFYAPGSPLPTGVALWPAQGSAANFRRIFELVPLLRFTLNSLLVVLLAVPLTLLTGSWAGFSMALLPAAAQRRWVLISLAALMVPGIALWSTRFLIFRWLGWLDTIWALIAPAWMGSSPFFVLMFYRAFRRIPAPLYEAAYLEGAGVLQTWRWIALPAARSTTIAVAVLAFVFYWGDFINPLLYLRSESLFTLPVALQMLQQLDPSDWPLLMAAAVWAALVPLLLFLFSIWLLRKFIL